MTLDELKGLLAETAAVEAGGHTWDVADPTFEEALDVQRLYLTWAKAADGDEKDPLNQVDSARRWGAAAAAAISACVRVDGMVLRLDGKEAGTILRRTGTVYANALADACLRRCGVSVPEGTEGEGAAEADPT